MQLMQENINLKIEELQAEVTTLRMALQGGLTTFTAVSVKPSALDNDNNLMLVMPECKT